MFMDAAYKINLAVLIVNTIAALIAVVAAIAAIYGNTQAREAANNADEQFRKNIQEQNRLINVSLFDLRSGILSEVQPGGFKFDRTRARMLFNSEISDLIKEYDTECAEADRLGHLKKEYLDAVRRRLSGETYEETADFLNYLNEYEVMNPERTSKEIFEQVQDSIRRNGMSGKWRYGVSPNEEEYVDFISVSEEYCRHFQKSEAICGQLHREMERFIEASIQ